MIVKRQFLAPVLAVITLIAATGVLASNMGFKRILRLKGPDGGQTSASGKNHIGLPYIPKQGIVTVRDLFFDIGGSISSISQHRKSDDQFELYSATVNTVPPDGFPLEDGDAVIIITTNDELFVPSHY